MPAAFVRTEFSETSAVRDRSTKMRNRVESEARLRKRTKVGDSSGASEPNSAASTMKGNIGRAKLC